MLWQGAKVFTGMIKDGAEHPPSYGLTAGIRLTNQSVRCLMCSVMAAGTPYRPIPGADLQRRAGKPCPQAAAAIAQKKRTPTVESFLMPCPAGAGCIGLSFHVQTHNSNV